MSESMSWMVPCARGCGNVITVVSNDPNDRFMVSVCLPCAEEEMYQARKR